MTTHEKWVDLLYVAMPRRNVVLHPVQALIFWFYIDLIMAALLYTYRPKS